MDSNWPPLETLQSSLIGLVVFTAAIAPLAVPSVLGAVILITFAQDVSDYRPLLPQVRNFRNNPATPAVLLFLFYGFASCLWSDRPDYSFSSLAQATLIGLGSWYVAASLARRLPTLDRVRQTRFTRAVPLASIFVGLYFLLDGLTSDGATLLFVRNAPWLFDGFENTILKDATGYAVGLHEIYFNRTAAALTMALGGLAAALRFWPLRTIGNTLGVLAVVILLAISLKSGSATALFAAAAGVGCFVLANWSSYATMRILQILFLALTIGAIPLATVPKAFKLETNPALPFSFQERVIIWDDLARLAFDKAVTGIGINSIKFRKSSAAEVNPTQPGNSTSRTYWHPHNGYLQVWLELGIVGAILFSLAGYLLLGRIGQLTRSFQPFAAGLAGGTMAMIGPGWGLWQPWLLAAIGYGWLTLVMVRFEFEADDSRTA